ARENAKGSGEKIGTTGKGIGPAYEDKVSRRGLRVYDLFHPQRFAAKLKEILDFHNFVLTQYFKAEPVDFQTVYDQAMRDAEIIKPMVVDVSAALYDAHAAGCNLLFEGAQGALLDIDHGTYPFVTSSNCVAGQAAAGSGIGPGLLHYVLGITKAYCTRVGGGPFPSELDIDAEGTPGHQMFSVGKEFGTVTGRKRRCGWFDAALLRRSARINGLTGLCITKLDVLDGLPEIKICTGYRLDGKTIDLLPIGADDVTRCEPIYETLPGWPAASTARIKRWADLPGNAQTYLNRLEQLCGVPIAIVSTGPERDETILRDHPFK
ncbi:MAG: adenylosuccinate synthase, partial [Azonexus sp.]|nr:adenylosuccinate synthase [Azonexus sp.]